jgi:hypothetical protein
VRSRTVAKQVSARRVNKAQPEHFCEACKARQIKAPPRVKRDKPIALKTTADKRQQFDRLRLLTGRTFADIFELALDAFEATLG